MHCAADDCCGVGLLRGGTRTQRWQRGWQVDCFVDNAKQCVICLEERSAGAKFTIKVMFDL